jgi:hypothetical protein
MPAVTARLAAVALVYPTNDARACTAWFWFRFRSTGSRHARRREMAAPPSSLGQIFHRTNLAGPRQAG